MSTRGQSERVKRPSRVEGDVGGGVGRFLKFRLNWPFCKLLGVGYVNWHIKNIKIE